MNVTIKNLPDDVGKALKEIAADRGRSLNSEVIQALCRHAEEEKRRIYIRDHMDDLKQFAATMPKLKRGTIERIIREDRDSH